MTTGADRRLAEVYGVARGIPLTYVTRSYVDSVFLNNLTRDKHLVVFGGSKQGKTCLRKQCLHDDDYVVIQCSTSTTRDQIYEMLLKHAGAAVVVTEKTSISGSRKVDVTLTAKGKIPLLAEANAQAAGEVAKTTSTESVRTTLEIDAGDPNDVIRVLTIAGFSKFIVLEDFHYLQEEVQRQIVTCSPKPGPVET